MTSTALMAAVPLSVVVPCLDEASPFLEKEGSPADSISSAKKQDLKRANKSFMLWLPSSGRDICPWD